MKVNANQLRKGNVVEVNGKLYVVHAAQNIQPGKGTPVTQLELRGIIDGIKINERYRTTESVERVFIDERDHTFVFSEGDTFTFMDVETYEQVTMTRDQLGDSAQYLMENMPVSIKLYEGVPVSISIPQSVTLEVIETDPAFKGQTAASSYKPAKMSNGMRVMVPPHIGAGTRIVINTDDGAYIERAKD